MTKQSNVEIPAYLFLGFLESGKTTFIQDTLQEDYFNDGQRTLLIACEEGEEEFDEEILKNAKTQIVYVEDEEDLTKDFLFENIIKYAPDRVLIEFNGMWNIENLVNVLDTTPLTLFQVITLTNAETFELYMNNMRSLAVEMFKISELVIMNRCVKDTPRATYRRSIKAVNRRIQVAFESESMDDDVEEQDFLPYEIDADEIQLEDEDFGIWFMDAMERPELYAGKTLITKARVMKNLRLPKGCFVPGRHAMTCCADDIQFIGYLCHINHAKSSTIKSLKNEMWITLTAEIKAEYSQEYGEVGPVLYAKRIEEAEKPEDELVYF